MSRSLMVRVVFGVLAVAMGFILIERSAEAGLFKHRHNCCVEETTCCEEAPVCCEGQPVCCEKAPTCCEEVVVETPACECEPECCETECCKPKRKRCFGFFKRFRKQNCCQPICGC